VSSDNGGRTRNLGREVDSRGRRGKKHGRVRDQTRTAAFKMRRETTLRIQLLDEYGNRRYVTQYGKMGITKHQRVLSVLEKRALRYRDRCGSKYKHATSGDSIDEICMVATEGLTDDESVTTYGAMNINQYNKWRRKRLEGCQMNC
jgi:hypothetical protein